MNKVIVDKEFRFTGGETVEVSSEYGWVEAVVTKAWEVVINTRTGEKGILYQVRFPDMPATPEPYRNRLSVATGRAIRAK
ncbi:hypothetical protein [Ktedonobacter racemifer]|uniref:Uncharacterized protein n=1 Tax=Ktedonobacter racemifer DSM 44963 TaxID=485913 RepID=D6U028_KTERA|nr:hypothetical protein [Ktedonobacter racemifer]EFH82168.1 hypothetical protein Krac_2954 [Ktedonobacter racemifer DSM 44963]